jgi:D-beta-D-heptose 7-phosphate kinase/D-beta-D-heptose 1-phosphate adenosyltransferase
MISTQNTNPKILVIGDIIVDQYLWGSSNRISPEAPVPIIKIENQSIVLGGAGNVTNNLSALGAEVDLISVIGNCKVSKELKELLSYINVDTKYLVCETKRITSKKSRIIASHQQVIRYDLESTTEINQESTQQIIKNFKKIIGNYDVVLLSDYGKGVLTSQLTKSLISIANKSNKKILIDPKGFDYSKYKDAYLLTPNKKEASEATNLDINNKETLRDAMSILKKTCNLNYSLVTLSEDGIAILDDKVRIYPTVAREIFDVTGAGDTVLASLGFALACGKGIDEAVKFANLASGVVVGKIGSATASLDEINKYEAQLVNQTSDESIKSWSEINSIVEQLKTSNNKIVFTNGCFDILHLGHIKYLEKAKSFGDILILGLNSDSSVKRLKGSKRPINCELDRAYILASLEVIDYVVVFEDDTPLELIKLIKPDILVKGSDYDGKEIVGQEIAKELKLVSFIDGKGTTKVIDKIKSL